MKFCCFRCDDARGSPWAKSDPSRSPLSENSKNARIRHSSQTYGCLKFFLTVELWKFITKCRKTQINWNLCQFFVFFNALHAGKFSWFLKVFWHVNQRCKFGLRSTPSAVRAIFESRYLTICFEILYETSQSCSMKARMHVGKFSWFLKVFWYVNQSCKFGLKSTPSAARVIFESRYLTICFEILYETSQSCSMKSRIYVGKFSWFFKVFWYVKFILWSPLKIS